ncbi:hypothetical protein Scep_004130 [Stephania cephalantha]|uniref:Uncharacterized protein n=1 Tax=Stephania cephalantha TaxID=152367 RepID=A0AAP0PYR7_9MAGN
MQFERRGQSWLHDWLGFELMSTFAIETASFRGVYQKSCCLPSLPLKSSSSFELFVAVVYSVPRRRTLDTQISLDDQFDCAAAVSDRLALLGTSSLQGKRISKVEFLKSCKGVVKLKRSVREVTELYGSEKSLPVVKAHRPLSGLHSIALSALESSVLQGFSIISHSLVDFTNTSEMPPTVNELYLHLYTVNHDGVTFIDTRSERFYELTQATPDQPVDDEAVYYNVAGECPRGRFYGLGSLRRKKRRYAYPGASTSQMPEMVPRSEFDSVSEQLRHVVAFMQRQFGMTMDGAGLSQPQPPQPPLPPHEQPQPQTDPADPPQQQDNIDREMQD